MKYLDCNISNCGKTILLFQDKPKEYLEINLLVDHVITIVLQREEMEDCDEHREEEESLLLWSNTSQVVEQVLQGSPVIASKVR